MNIDAQFNDFLAQHICYRRDELDDFFDESLPNWGRFDAELGYLVNTFQRTDGINGTDTIHSLSANGKQRQQVHYANEPCRINTYGNSFTMCSQCNDGESWQEYLAGHFREPIRNFGIGGYGVYQAYRRMRRIEATELAADVHILNIFCDDNYRNLDLARWVRNNGARQHIRGGNFHMLHANPWCHLQWNPETCIFDEKENPCNTRELLYQFCDIDFVRHLLEHDFFTQLTLARAGLPVIDIKLLQNYADSLNLDITFTDTHSCLEQCEKLAWILAQKSSLHTVQLHKQFCESNGKQLIVCTSYTSHKVEKACAGKQRDDNILYTGLQESGLPFVDGLDSHSTDYQNFSCSPHEYAKRFYIGHYAPAGNYFYAQALRDCLVQNLTPAPPSYRPQCPSSLAVEKQLL